MKRSAVRGTPAEAGYWGEELWPVDNPEYIDLKPVEFDTWERRAGARPHLEVVGERGAVEAVDVIGRHDRMPGWAVRLRLVQGAQGLEYTQKEERRRPPDQEEGVTVAADGNVMPYRRTLGPPPVLLTSKLIRQVGLADVEETVKELLTSAVIREKILGPGWNRAIVRPRRRQQDDAVYALWANRYAWALSQPDGRRRPNKYIADVDTSRGIFRTPKQVENMVRRARERGMMTPTDNPGRAGGSLTPRALKLLADLEVEPGADHLVDDGRGATARSEAEESES